MLFLQVLLSQYNLIFHRKIIQQCPCYENYKSGKMVNYLACVENAYKIQIHQILPIMIGSWIDILIRGIDVVKAEHQFWGCLYMEQQMKICSSFSTYDSLSMHLKYKKATNTLSVFWYFYYKESGVAIEYVDKQLKWKYNGIEYMNWDVIRMINESNIFHTEITSKDLIDLFDGMLSSPDYNMHDLKNRKIITAVKILEKKLKQIDLKKPSKRNIDVARRDFAMGMFVNVLSKNNSVESQNLTNNKQFIVPLQHGRLGAANALVSKIVRATNQGSRNLTMLRFPRDGTSFLCTHHNKELKNTGESFIMTSGTIVSIECDQTKVHKWLDDFIGSYRVILNYQFTNCYVDWGFEFFLKLKQTFPMINATNYKQYLFINTQGASLLKYHSSLKIYVSPYEATYFNLQFKHNESISLIPKQIPFLLHTPPSKITVAINNSQNMVFMLTEENMIPMLEEMRGLKCYSHFVSLTTKPSLPSLLPKIDFDYFYSIYEKLFPQGLPKAFGDDNDGNEIQHDIFLDKNILKLIKTPTRELMDNSRSKLKKIEAYCHNLIEKVKGDFINPWMIMPYVSFGDCQGATIEDGIVADKSFIKQLKPIIYLTHSQLVFSSNQKINESFLHIKDSSSLHDGKQLLSFTYNQLLKCPTSANYIIKIHKLGLMYVYVVSNLKLQEQEHFDISYSVIDKNIKISIKSTITMKVGVGSKISNCWGQKNIISEVVDLSHSWGRTRGGKIVHPQILYSPVSLLSRVPTGQLHYMLQSPDLAFGPNGEIMAPIPILISSLSTHTQNRITPTKLDTLMRANGFLSMNLINTLHRFRVPFSDPINDLLNLHNLFIE